MKTKRIGSAVQIGHAHFGRWAGGVISEPAFAITPVKEVVPNPPVIQSVSLVENAPGTIKLAIELPSTNTDGSPLAIGELVRLRVKYGPASNDLRYQNDFPPGSELSFAPGMPGIVYLAAQVQDSHGNWSALSSAVQSPSIPSIEESLAFWAHRLNADAIFTNNSPSPGYVAWSNVKLSFRNETWEIQNGNTNKRYIWWDYSLSKTTFQTSDDPPSLDLEDVLVAVNINGTCYLYMYRPMVAADFLRAGILQSANWSETAGSQFSLNDGTFKLGGSSSPKLSWDGSTLQVMGIIQAGANSWLGSSNAVQITSQGINVGSSGHIRGGATGYNQGVGFWLGYDGTTYKFFIGNASGNRLTWDGSSLTVFGTIQAASGFLGSSSGVVIESSGVNVGSAGYVRGGKSSYGLGSGFWLGFSGGSYRFDIGDSSRYMRWDGSNLFVTGQVQGLSGSYLVTGTAPRVDVGYSYSHRIALYTSGGSLGTFIDIGAITVYDAGYTPVKLQPAAPHIYLYPYAGGSATIQSYNNLTILAGGSKLTLSGQYGTVSVIAYCGEILRGDSSYVYLPYTSIYWKYGGPTYGGAFFSPAGGIYVYIGTSRYAIPYYGPV
jgi:hypothetical protein